MSNFDSSKGDVLTATPPLQSVGSEAPGSPTAPAGSRREAYRDFIALSERYPDHSAREICNMYRELNNLSPPPVLGSPRDALEEFRYNGQDVEEGLFRQRYGLSGSGSNSGTLDHRTLQDYFACSMSAVSDVTSLLSQEQLRTLRNLPADLLALIIDNAARARRERRSRRAAPNECSFCKNNGEVETYYKGHMLKDRNGRVLCPVLRSYSCPRCHATGDDAHTIKYCPLNSALDDHHLTPISVLKATERLASGARRRGPLSLHLPQHSAGLTGGAPASPNQLSPTAPAWSPFTHQY